jgi:hypothetical protein
MRTLLRLGCVLCLSACGASSPRPATPDGPRALDRERFNQLALRLELPIFWASDTDGSGTPDPDEIRALRFYPTEGTWVQDGRFTPAFDAALAQIRQAHEAAPPDDARLAAVLSELDHAAPTLVESDLRALPPSHQTFARHMTQVAELIDRLYARQTGASALEAQAAGADAASRSLFRRNWGPSCRGALTERDPACSALPGAPSALVDVYPAALQGSDDTFCAALEARPDATELLSPFTVVRQDGETLRAVPYSEAYADEMRGVTRELRAASDALRAEADEAALVAYLDAAATAFETNVWGPADEAWSRMGVRNSRWYVRVGPDETYWEPCSQKAGFHLTFARINPDSLVWQERLTPIQRDMEGALAALASDAYQARDVAFHMPDFIDIVLNAGDDRDPFGATIGQSLPNWGAVADEGRGRTVAMSNLYTDPDSMTRRRAQAMSLLSSTTMADYTSAATPGLLSTILHEATHNLGPSHDYRANGQTDAEAFGGGLASMLEELKAQSGALFFVEWLRARGVLTDAQAREVYVDSIVWAFGHVSRGMYTPSGQRKAYSQLAAIQLGVLLDEGALRFDADATAADGTHHGAFTLDFERFPAAAERLMTQVMRIKATGDRSAAEALATRYVDGDRVPHALLVERYRGFPQVTFVYNLSL